jgi:hypothetical protein
MPNSFTSPITINKIGQIIPTAYEVRTARFWSRNATPISVRNNGAILWCGQEHFGHIWFWSIFFVWLIALSITSFGI